MSKFTPGPWHVENRFVVAKSGKIIADLSGLTKAEPNARLIALAPELLAFIEGFYEEDFKTDSARARWQALIKKATGDSK